MTTISANDLKNYFRELELQQAFEETKQDIKSGQYHTNIKKHIKKLVGTHDQVY